MTFDTRKLRKRYPDRMISKCKIWTQKRNTIESMNSHDETVGLLIILLTAVSTPPTEKMRRAMKRMIKELQS